MVRIGIDLGGTKIEGVALDPKGDEIVRTRVATPAGDYRGILQTVKGLVQRIAGVVNDPYTVGIGTPGALSLRTGLLKNSNSTCLNGQPLLSDLEEMLGCPVRMANDANCFALSEAVDGAAAGARVVFAVIVGTGTGGGIVVNRSILTGPNAIAGEWGHNPLPWKTPDENPGPPCYCGKEGCIETFLSGPGLAADHEKRAGDKLQPQQIVDRASQGDRDCEATLLRYEERMARALAHVINILDPEVILLGGGMSKIERLYENVPKLWGRYVFSDSVETRLLRPVYGDSSGVRGAARLWEIDGPAL